MSSFCTKCGGRRVEGSAFCPQCGQKFLDDALAAQPQAPHVAVPPTRSVEPALAPAPPPTFQPAPPAVPGPPYQPQPAATYSPPPAGYAPPQKATQSNVKRVIFIVIGVAVILLGLAQMLRGLGMLSGGSRRVASSAPTAPSDPTSFTPAIAPAGSVTASWLIGTWGPNCPRMNTGGVTVIPGSTYTTGTISSSTGTGTWSLSGNVMTTISSGLTEVSTWTYVGPNAARVIAPDGRTVNLTRCTP